MQGLEDLFERELSTCSALIDEAIEAVDAARGASLDRRLARAASQLRDVHTRVGLAQAAGADLLCELKSATETMPAAAGALAALVARLAERPPLGRTRICTALLEHLAQRCGAERGYVMLYLAESSEAEVVCAMRFRTRNLALEEYKYSRTLLVDALHNAALIRLADASVDERYSHIESVQELKLRSVLVLPMVVGRHPIGAVYLENQQLANVFSAQDARSAQLAAQLVACCLHHARLIPATTGRQSRVFLDPSRAGWEMIGEHPKLVAMLGVVRRVADLPVTVLVEGESGTGKELVARALHHSSSRSDRPFVAVNCAAICGELAESELFGHEKGAYTGAAARHAGCFEQAHGGTLFLDEVNELSPPVQAKLLRVLERCEVRRLGGERSIPVDVRVVAASSTSLRSLSAQGRFQEPLFHRLNVIRLEVPPLRERQDDIRALTDHFVARYSSTYDRKVTVDESLHNVLRSYPFPGNVRELENLVRRMVALADDSDVLGVADLPAELRKAHSERPCSTTEPGGGWECAPVTDLAGLRHREAEARRYFAAERRRLVERAISEEGSITAAARRLKVNRVTLHKIRREPSPRP